jgi:Zn-finger nucleic acid-binding protein
MRQYERSGIHVDQCSECRGIFLDRGELERLIDAEAAFHAPAAAPAVTAPADTRRYDDRDDRDRRERDRRYEEQRRHEEQSRYGYSGHGHSPHRKRKSFLSELFD